MKYDFFDKMQEMATKLEKTFNSTSDTISDTISDVISDTINESQKFMLNWKCPYYESSCKLENCDCAKYKAYAKVNEPGMVEQTLIDNGFDPNQETWPLIMNMQKSFASRLHKMDDLTKEETDYWIDKYLVCIEDEVRELREHLDIYNNKNNQGCSQAEYEKSIEELKKEVIDILHFVMDVFLCGGVTAEIIKDNYLKTYASNVKDTHDFIGFAYVSQKGHPFNFGQISNDDYILKLSCKLLDASSEVRQQISWKHWKKPSPTIDQEKLLTAFTKLFKALIDLFVATMTAEDIRDIYIKKNCENIWRQNFNY